MSGVAPLTDRVSDTQRRFLIAVTERLPVDAVHEVYLFAPIRQGGVETGIAVIAMRGEGGAAARVADGASEPGAPHDTDAGGGVTAGDVATEDSAEDTGVAASGEELPAPGGAIAEAAGSPNVEGAATHSGGETDRFTVHTASYRLQLKGPDRGRWTVDVVEEADAPLVTVDAVVRGVQRRSGEVHEVERIPAGELPGVLSGRSWASTS